MPEEPDALPWLVAALREDGHDVRITSDRHEVLRLCRQWPADLVILAGVAAASDESIAALRREIPALGIVTLLSAWGIDRRASVRRARDVGADLAVDTSVDQTALIAAIHELLGSRPSGAGGSTSAEPRRPTP